MDSASCDNEEEPTDETVNITSTTSIEQKLKYLMYSPHFCGICLENDKDLSSVLAEFEIFVNEKTHSKPLKYMINCIFNNDLAVFPVSPYACKQCIDKTIQSYIFILKTTQSMKTLQNYIDDFYQQTDELNNQLHTNSDYTRSNSNFLIIIENKDDIVCKNILNEVDSTTDFEISEFDEEITINSNTNGRVNKVTTVEQVITLEDVKPEIVSIDVNPTTVTNEIKAIEFKTTKDRIKPARTKNNAYKCVECNLVFITFKLWKEHEKTHHKVHQLEKVQCKICNKTFDREQKLLSHYQVHSKIKCKICHLLVTYKDLNEHLKLNHQNMIYECQYCDLAYYTILARDAHLKISHPTEADTSIQNDSTQCLMCMKYIDGKNVQSHTCSHKCTDCTEIPCIHHKYLMSYREQTLNHVGKIKCLDCDYVCRKKHNLIGHVNREHLGSHPHACEFCGTQYYSKNTLKLHILRTHQENRVCEYCDKIFTNEKKYEDHLEPCQNNTREYKCDKCPASFDCVDRLSNHEDARHSKETYRCDTCTSQFKSEASLKQHKNRVHRNTQIVNIRSRNECIICEKRFEMKGELVWHMKTHGPNDYSCIKCNKNFPDLRKLQLHNRLHKRKRLECKICGKRILDSAFDSHMKKHKSHSITDQYYTCDQCGKQFSSHSYLKIHIKSHLPPEPCNHCGKLIKPSSLLTHLHYHNIKDNPKFKEKRRKTFLKDKLKCKCDFCDYSTITPMAIQAHINRYHLKVKPFICNVCGNAYGGQYQLNEHMLTHSEKRHICEICDRGFTYKIGLKKHMSRHTGERPFICDVCGEGFITGTYLKDHKLKHGSKTVLCPFPMCGGMFYTLREMRCHFKKVHWKRKDRKFDPKQVKELAREHYSLFQDGRRAVADSD